MSELKSVLSQYCKNVEFLEEISGHHKYFQRVVRGAKNTTGKTVRVEDAAEYAADLEKLISQLESSLLQNPISNLPKPEYFSCLDLDEPYPINRFPTVLRDAIEAISMHVQAPLGLAAHAVIASAAHLAQPRVDAVTRYNEPMPCSLFILSLGDSGSRKSTCHRLAFRIINENEQNLREKFREKKAKKLESTRAAVQVDRFDLDPQETMSDVVFEGLAGHMIRGCSFLTVDTDDGGQWFGGHSLTSTTRLATCAGYTRAFDNGYIERTRSLGNANGSGFAYDRRLGISLMAQDAVVRKFLLDADLQEQGLLARFMLTNTQNLAGTRFIQPDQLVGQELTDSRILRYWERCKEIIATPPKIDPVTRGVKATPYYLTDCAVSLWVDHYNNLESEQRGGGEFAHIRPFASRGAELSRRLATVIAFFDGKSLVDTSSMQAGIDVVTHSIREWARYIQNNAQASDEERAIDLIKDLSDKKIFSFTVREVQQRGPSYARKSASTVKNLLGILVENRFVFPPEETGRKYLINPHYLHGVVPLTS